MKLVLFTYWQYKNVIEVPEWPVILFDNITIWWLLMNLENHRG